MNEDIDLAKYIDKDYMFLDGKFSVYRNMQTTNYSKKLLLGLMYGTSGVCLFCANFIYLNTNSVIAFVINICLAIFIGINMVIFTYSIFKIKMNMKQRMLTMMLYVDYTFFIILLSVIYLYLNLLGNYFENIIGIVFILICLLIIFTILYTKLNFLKEKLRKKSGKSWLRRSEILLVPITGLAVINPEIFRVVMTIGLTIGLPFVIFLTVQSLVQQIIVVNKYSDKIDIEQLMKENIFQHD